MEVRRDDERRLPLPERAHVGPFTDAAMSRVRKPRLSDAERPGRPSAVPVRAMCGTVPDAALSQRVRDPSSPTSCRFRISPSSRDRQRLLVSHRRRQIDERGAPRRKTDAAHTTSSTLRALGKGGREFASFQHEDDGTDPASPGSFELLQRLYGRMFMSMSQSARGTA